MSQKDDANAEFDPKHRIVGAIILVSLAVIFVPMILDEREPPSEIKDISEIPERSEPSEASDTKVMVSPVADMKQAKRGEQAKEKEKTDAVVRRAVPGTPPSGALRAPNPAPGGIVGTASGEVSTKSGDTKSRSAKESAPKNSAQDNKKNVKVSTGAKTVKEGWVVQVGTFSNSENAKRLRDKLKKYGHLTSMERITLNGGEALRLRVGPFRDKSLASKTQAQIRKDIGVQGVVLAYP